MGFLREQMKILEGDLILGFHYVCWKYNFKETKNSVKEERGGKGTCSAAPVCLSTWKLLLNKQRFDGSKSTPALTQGKGWSREENAAFPLWAMAGAFRGALSTLSSLKGNLGFLKEEIGFGEWGSGIRLSNRNFNVSLIYSSSNTSWLLEAWIPGPWRYHLVLCSHVAFSICRAMKDTDYSKIGRKLNRIIFL